MITQNKEYLVLFFSAHLGLLKQDFFFQITIYYTRIIGSVLAELSGAECEAAGMKVHSFELRSRFSTRKRWNALSKVEGESLPQAEFKYLVGCRM